MNRKLSEYDEAGNKHYLNCDAVVLKEAIRLMREVDEVIESAGGRQKKGEINETVC